MSFQYTSQRDEMLKFLPEWAATVLDVGCGAGTFGLSLRSVGRSLATWAVEPDANAVAAAAPNYDHVLHGRFPGPTLPQGHFDVIYANDVLEHMLSPENALTAMRDLLAPGGVVVASIPNVRHLMVTGPLVVRGRWNYTDEGLLDRTHVRFFTRSAAEELFTSNGWQIDSVTGINRRVRLGERDRRSLRALSRITRGRSDAFFFLEYVVVASPRDSA